MAQQKEYCKETSQTVTLYLNIWEDEYTGLENLKGIRCIFQAKCPIYDRVKLCPTIIRVKKSHSESG